MANPHRIDAADGRAVPPIPAGLARIAGQFMTQPVPDAGWQPLSGGRTNRVWERGGVVCKLYDSDGDTPLFRNDPGAERRMLQHLTGTGLAPDLLCDRTGDSPPALIYRTVPGQALRRPNAALIKALWQVHSVAAPVGLPMAPSSPNQLLAQSEGMLATLPPGIAADLVGHRPALPEGGKTQPVLLHGDPVAANAIARPCGGITLVDWQCPALGDPVLDLAIALSPAMQTVYGDGPLTPAETGALLAAYPDPDTVARFRRMAPLLHWRMAIYCAWRMAQGDLAYGPALTAELDGLNRV